MTMDVNRPEKWDEDYLRGGDGWDLGGPAAVFKRLAQSGRFQPGRMLVPCAGRGHDAREFARHGFQVTAVDFSDWAVAEMQRLQSPEAPVEVRREDLFAMPAEFTGAFDYVLEYTCFCAIDPGRREEYADMVRRVLKPGGIYIDLAFPMDQRPGGPPFTVSEGDVFRLFGDRGFDLIMQEMPPDSVKPRRGKEKLLVFRKRAEAVV
jgi:SAM-dependent methyltransferase